MKVYMFYQSFSMQLDPILYGFTSDKLRASIFKLYRPNLVQVIKDVSKSEYNEMRDKLKRKEIIPHEFQTSIDHFGTRMVSQIATEEEILHILLNKEELVLNELSKHTAPIEIFKKGIQKDLKVINMDVVEKYAEEVVVIPGDEKHVPELPFKIDELGLFIQLYGFTMTHKDR